MHWSWAAAGLATAILLRRWLGGHAPAVEAALAVAALRGRQGHRGDLEAGHDLARAARARGTPLAALRSVGAERLRGCSARARRRARRQVTQTLLLGRRLDGRAVRIPFEPGGGGHALVLGATGSGKTVTQTLLAVSAIAQGRAAIVVDPKGDARMREQLRGAAGRAGRRFVSWSPSGPDAYNPYARGGETEIADRLLAGERFTEPHYLRQAQRYLGHAIRALRACELEVSLAAVVELLDAPQLEQLLRRAPPEVATAGHAYLDSLTPRQLRDLAGVRDRLAILAESELGPWLAGSEGDGRRSFDLLEVARSGSVAYLALESDSRPLLARMLAAAIVQDLQSAVAELQGRPVPTLVVIDEFSAVSAEHVVALFGRARSAGLTIVLGTQELADLRLPGQERTLERLVGNLSLLIAHRQVVPASAELLSRLGGSRGAWRVSWSGAGRRTRARIEEPRLAEQELTELAPGSAAVIAFGSRQPSCVVRISNVGGEER
jgi:hypothetical protein